MQVHYLEIVSPDVDALCEAYANIHGTSFTAPDETLGNARVAVLKNGGRIGIRAPMREDEAPVIRPYLRVDNIENAVKAAKHAGATIAHPPLEIPSLGTFAIYILGGVDHGLWQV